MKAKPKLHLAKRQSARPKPGDTFKIRGIMYIISTTDEAFGDHDFVRSTITANAYYLRPQDQLRKRKSK